MAILLRMAFHFTETRKARSCVFYTFALNKETMIVYREEEVIEIIKMLALGYGNKIDNEISKIIIEGYRRAVVKNYPNYQWLDQEENI